ncbi:unnamed protein product [Rotaria sp. Silwood1]|nr:unnamed protein product [Rotaria sp. Silwood1]CAF3328010.1 unnamed protein product [Rotaria sp. Silwood1]CAF3335931.1 unnamed protein product [Rotaria sp. Silwood1]CAF3346661.1 unnamed protein product [Rotaria sp. Silwood1]CAF4519887.1 unnamed protein product [Rotaria sp. Silwood1]
MSTTITTYLDTLPVELLNYILNFLDTHTILLSFRYVCKRFYIISNVYDQYKLNLNLCRKYNFYHFCRIINPLHIISLILSDDDKTPGQISLFLSFFNLKQFIHLHSLTLLEIDDSNLHIILKDLTYLLLKSLTIKSRTSLTLTHQTLTCLSTTLEQSSLKEFTLSIWCFEIYDFIWPNQCEIEYLQISNRITFEQYCTILERCLFLRTLIIKDVLWNDTDMAVSTHYRQLKFLTLEDNRMDIYKLEQFLSVTPSLIYLKVIGMAYLTDSYRWEKILRIKLPNLDRFEFFFLSWKNVNYSFSDIESFIRPFETAFWLENKQWIVNCDYIINPTEVMLYSIPICKSYFQYHNQSNKISCSNFTKTNNNNETMMDNVSQLRLNLVKTIYQENFLRKTELPPYPLFRNVTELTLDLDYKCPSCLSQPLSSLINLSYITQLSLNLNYDLAFDLYTAANLINIFKQTSNIHTFEIYNNLSSINSNTTVEDICLLIPSYIQHLKITVKNVNEMKIVFDRFQYLSSITFRFSFDTCIPSAKVIESFLNIKNDLTYKKDDCSIRVWLNELVKN